MRLQKLDDNYIAVIFNYDPKIVSLVKSIPGRAFYASRKLWVIPNDGLLPTNIDKLAKAGFAIPPELSGQGRPLSPSGAESAPITDLNASSVPLYSKLYPYQKEIVDFMVARKCVLNASFVGAGKTVTSLCACEVVGAKRILILTPKSLVMQWAHGEGKKWLPEKLFHVITGNKKERDKIYWLLNSNVRGYYVTNYETIRLDLDRLNVKWDAIICDEAHRLANPGTKLYRALKFLRADYRFALTATPIMNKATDAWGIINWLMPGTLGGFRQFVDRYAVRDTWGSVKFYKNLPELAQRIAPFIIRKTLDEVNLQLPDKVETDIPVNLTEKEKSLYNKIKQELLFDIEKQDISKLSSPIMLQNGIVKLGKLFELCDSMELIGESTESSKLEALKEHLEGTLINGQKAIIITRFTRMAEIIRRELSVYNPLLITGQTGNRQEILNTFKDNPAHQILIGSEAIGQGLNIQCANILYNVDLPWNPARLEQRAGRIHRQGQEKPVFIYNLVVENSVEKWLQKKIAAKAELSQTLLPKNINELKEMLQ